MDDDPVLTVSINDVLIAFFAAADHTPKGGTEKDYLERRKLVALGILDWATCESDRGRELLEAKAQAGLNRKGDGSITVGQKA